MSAEIDNVLKAYETLITAEIQACKRGRFERIMKFCEQATRLERLGVQRVADDTQQPQDDADDNGINIHAYGEIIGNALQQNVQAPRAYRGPADQIDMIREIMMMVQPMIQSQAAATENAQRRAEIDALLAERAAREVLGDSTVDVDARIRTAIATKGDANAVVHSQLLRGHQAHEEGREGNPGDGGAGDAVGAGGPGAPVEGRQQEALVCLRRDVAG